MSLWEVKALIEEREQKVRWEDPIVREVRAAREALFADAGYDLNEFCRRLSEQQTTAGARLVARPPRRPEG